MAFSLYLQGTRSMLGLFAQTPVTSMDIFKPTAGQYANVTLL